MPPRLNFGSFDALDDFREHEKDIGVAEEAFKELEEDWEDEEVANQIEEKEND